MSGLEVAGLSVRYGAVTAVENLDLHAPTGRITGLIGPNGAGKTTTFNACSGLLRPAAGRLTFEGADVTRLGPSARARRGIGRTFQRMELFTSMTVAENVALGREAALGGASPWRQMMAGRRARTEVRAACEEALERCGLGEIAERPVRELSTGQRRLVELARACAGDYRLLLLDEPSSGLDQAETEAFGAVLVALVRSRGVGILLVEHDMAVVMTICEYLYVLDFGKLVFEGVPDVVRDSPVVRAAYLGSSGEDGQDLHPEVASC